MSKQANGGTAQGAQPAKQSEPSLRDFVRTLKKNAKALKALQALGNKPGLKEAITSVEAENAKIVEAAKKFVERELTDAIKNA